jgi:hypothetical protein
VDSTATLWIAHSALGFSPLQPGGLNNAFFSAVSTGQYNLVGNNGSTWAEMDSSAISGTGATPLTLTITPAFTSVAVLSANSDLWTSVATFNQDIGIMVAGGSTHIYPTVFGQPEAWKESGGFAGTFSPNAAFLETAIVLDGGQAYTIKLVWRANKAGSSTIWAGAGPINGKFSPTQARRSLDPDHVGKHTVQRIPFGASSR